MGQSAAAPMNEAVNLLEKLAPEALTRARAQFPQLANELAGFEGGALIDELDIDRAQIMIVALDVVKRKADKENGIARSRMAKAKSRRLSAQVVTLLASSGVLAGMVTAQPTLTLINAMLTFAASIGALGADYLESLAKPGAGNIYEAYDRSNTLAYRSGALRNELELLVKHRDKADKEVTGKAIAEANAVCEELNKWLTQMAGTRA